MIDVWYERAPIFFFLYLSLSLTGFVISRTHSNFSFRGVVCHYLNRFRFTKVLSPATKAHHRGGEQCHLCYDAGVNTASQVVLISQSDIQSQFVNMNWCRGSLILIQFLHRLRRVLSIFSRARACLYVCF